MSLHCISVCMHFPKHHFRFYKTPDHPQVPQCWYGLGPFGRTLRRGWDAERCRSWQDSVRTLCCQRLKTFFCPGSHKNPCVSSSPRCPDTRSGCLKLKPSRLAQGRRWWPENLRNVYREKQRAVQMPLHVTSNKLLPAGQACVAPFQTPSGTAAAGKGSKRAVLPIHLSSC